MTARSILLDTSLLVLLIAGLTDRTLIHRHKNLSVYDEDGFDLLTEKLEEFSNILLTPNTLTEASNLLRQIGSPDRERLTGALQGFIRLNPERYIESSKAADETNFIRLGLTDAALIGASRDDIQLLSADRHLCLAAANQGLDAINFAHLYEQRFG